MTIKQPKTQTIIIFFSFVALYGIVLINLYFIQVQHHTFFTSLGSKQYNVTLTVPLARALIFDRTGTDCLAFNTESSAAFITPHALKDYNGLLSFLDTYFPESAAKVKACKRNSRFMYIKRRLSPEHADLIKSMTVLDIHILQESQRYYPLPEAASLVGFTDIDNKGLSGIELLYDETLTGTPSVVCLQQDARSGCFYFEKETKVIGQAGAPITLSIDSNLQFLLHKTLENTRTTFEAQEGAIIVINPKTGEVLANVTTPTFDPHHVHLHELENTRNKILTDVYELGSVIKIFAALAALEEQVVELDELIDCENVKTTYIHGRKVNTVPSSIAATIPFSRVIEKSNNIGIAKVVYRLGPKLYEHYQRLGFGRKTSLQFPGEQKGFINPPHAWSKQSIFSLSYGYEITANLMQLANALCIIANNGYEIPLTYLRSDAPPSPTRGPLYSAYSLEGIKKILENTTQQGTAKKAGIQGYRVMSKTGTANLLNAQHIYNPDKNIYTCAGIIEKDDYQRVIVVFIKEARKKNLYASTVAAPLFEQVAEKVLIHEKVI